MNQLPPEILENIFKQIESIKDLKSISNTCLQWRNIAEKVLEFRLSKCLSYHDNNTKSTILLYKSAAIAEEIQGGKSMLLCPFPTSN